MLEPRAGKPARVVLRGEGAGNGPALPDSHLTTTLRSSLRKLYDLKKYKAWRAGEGNDATRGDFTGQVLELLVQLSNWNRRPKDPVFTGVELFKRVRDIQGKLGKAVTKLDAGTIATPEEKVIRRLHARLTPLVTENAPSFAELERIHDHIQELVEILSDLECSKKVGLRRLRTLRDKLRKYRFSSRCGEVERNFIEALMKFVRTKGEHLLNYKDVKGAPRTNNDHELSYKQLKHFLRRVIGFTSANAYLLAHGERIVFVNPAEEYEGILDILRTMDYAEARQTIARERHSRNRLALVIHNPGKWEKRMEELDGLLAEMEIPVLIIK